MADAIAEEVVANDQQDDSGFEDGFNEVTGIEPPAAEPEKVEPPPVEKEEPTPEAPKEEETKLSAAETKALISRLEELDRIKSSQDKFAGHLGTLKETIEKLKTSQATGEPVEITDDDVKDIADDFPEFGSKFKSSLQKVVSKLRLGGSTAVKEFDPAPIQNEFSQKLEENARKYESKLLTAYHRDWKTVVNSDGFKVWLNTQPEEYRNGVNNSWDAEELSEVLDTFKTYEKTKAASVEKSTESKKIRASRLEAAVTPSGVKAPDTTALDENDAFLSGFKSVRG